ncbi:MAG: CinA family nicotinamide mononucleotide deamidase-related protein [Planctomycetaceae bacterium]|nr:CinA family nicotinamide mononucleotide deamidase-related protein [Planctomycetaceae bacterium]
MKAEIVAIGSELTDGAKLDTNSQWLSQQLTDLGIAVHFHTTVADNLDENVAVLKLAVERADVVLITGGLGPTLDDLTREAMAALREVPLEFDEPSLAAITEMFLSRGREMPERNRVQAMFPLGSTPLPNPVGTAPGIWMTIPRGTARPPAIVAAMPGVPSEMHRMFDEQVRPRLPVSPQAIVRARLNCFGLGESHTEQLLGDLTARGRNPEIGITAHEATITLRITAHGFSMGECDEMVGVARETIVQRLGAYVYGSEDEELEDIVVRRLIDSGQTLATVESGTGGLLSQRITNVRDFERCYLGGLILPSETAQRRELGLAPDLFSQGGAISEAVAREMAICCRARLGADYAVAITNDRGMEFGADLSLPAAIVAVAAPDQVHVLPVQRIGNRAIHRSRTVKSALNLLRLHLVEPQ